MGSPNAAKLLKGEEHFHRDLEVRGNLQREIQAGAVFTAFKVTDRLVMHSERVREFPSGDSAFGAKHRDAIVNRLAHS